ncbi:hypothetical protein [Ruminococcus sp.]|uniref:hypothetical protein n=1 Tax=Ruminococcus sp. TaxID=41978 RepID=UPI003F07816E
MAYLKALGVDTSDASMAYYYIPCTDGGDKWILGIANGVITSMVGSGFSEIVYTYTIGDIIEKLPKQIGWYALSICWENECIEYDNWISEEVTDYIGDFNFENRPIIEALYDCLCWVAENHKELLIKNI